MLASILIICGASVFTACSSNDNPVVDPVKPYDVTVEGKKKLRHVKLPMAEWLAGADFPIIAVFQLVKALADFPNTVPDNTDGGGVEP